MQLNLSTSLTSQLDLIVCSHVSNSGLTLNAFTSILGEIAKALFQEESQNNALNKMLNQHIQPLYDVILQ